MRIAVAIVLAGITCFSVEAAWASPERNDELARTYAFAFSGAFEATKHCPGVETDEQRLIALREGAQLGGDKDDRAFLTALFDKLRPDMEREIATKGVQAWCATAYTTFGPQGLRTIRRP